MTSDNATNFVGADREMRKLLRQLDEDEIQNKTAHFNIKWHFIPPGAPHFNGGCEAMVKSGCEGIWDPWLLTSNWHSYP